MFEKTTKIDVTDRELAILEAALQTQVKILGVEAGAGTAEARTRLNEVKGVLSALHRRQKRKRSFNFALSGWFRQVRDA